MNELKVQSVAIKWVRRQANYIRAKNQDVVLPICGDTGDGKSTLALTLASAFDSSFGVETLRRRIAWDSENYIELAQRAEPFSSLVLDEGEGMFSRDSMKGENRRFAMFLYKCRKLNLVHFLNFPEWESVDSTIRGFRADWRVDVEELGVARMMRRKQGDVWGQMFRFEFPPLEGLELWSLYEELADRAARGERVIGSGGEEVEESEPFISRLASEVEPRLAPLADQIRRHAGMENGDGGA